MYIIIAGGGTTGRELVKNLAKRKKDIVVIDNDKEVCDELFATYGVETVHGNATQIYVLEAAGIDKADMIISTMPNDADSLALSVLAKSFSVTEIVVLMRKKSYLEAYKTVGVTKILNIVDKLVDDILYEVEKPEIHRVALLGKGEVEVFSIKVPQKAKIVGNTISEIASNKKIPEESIIAGVYKEQQEELKVPRGNTKIEGGVVLFVITKSEFVKKTASFLMKT